MLQIHVNRLAVEKSDWITGPDKGEGGDYWRLSLTNITFSCSHHLSTMIVLRVTNGETNRLTWCNESDILYHGQYWSPELCVYAISRQRSVCDTLWPRQESFRLAIDMKDITLIIFLALYTLPTLDGFLFDKRGLFLVPSVAFRDRSTPSNWILYNQGWYYEESPVQALLMEKSLELIVQQDLDRNRVKMFTAEGKKRKELCIDGLNREMCTLTDDDGRIKNTFTMTNAEIEQFRQTDGFRRESSLSSIGPGERSPDDRWNLPVRRSWCDNHKWHRRYY